MKALILFLLVFAAAPASIAERLSLVGYEHEYAISGPALPWGSRHHEVGKELLRIIAELLEDTSPNLAVVPWYKDKSVKIVVYKDKKGREWTVVPEYMNSSEFRDGAEFVTPPLEEPEDEKVQLPFLKRAIGQQLIRKGERSSTHFTMDLSHLTLSQRVDFFIFIENKWPEIYRFLGPTRYGSVINRFGVPVAATNPGLLAELSALPEAARTQEGIRALFHRHAPGKLWKYSAANPTKLFGLDNGTPRPILEIRISDLVEDEAALRKVSMLARGLQKSDPEKLKGIRFEFPFGSRSVEKEEANRILFSMKLEGRLEGFVGYIQKWATSPTAAGVSEQNQSRGPIAFTTVSNRVLPEREILDYLAKMSNSHDYSTRLASEAPWVLRQSLEYLVFKDGRAHQILKFIDLAELLPIADQIPILMKAAGHGDQSLQRKIRRILRRQDFPFEQERKVLARLAYNASEERQFRKIHDRLWRLSRDTRTGPITFDFSPQATTSKEESALALAWICVVDEITPEHISFVKRVIDGEDRYLINLASRALAREAFPVSFIKAGLNHKFDGVDQRAFFDALAQRRDGADLIKEALNHPDPEIRGRANHIAASEGFVYRQLANHKKADRLKGLYKILIDSNQRDPEEFNRSRLMLTGVTDSLSHYRADFFDPETLPILEFALRHNNPKFRLRAAEILQEAPSGELIIRLLRQTTKETDHETQLALAKALVRASSMPVPDRANAVEDHVPFELIYETLQGWGKGASPQAVELIVRSLHHQKVRGASKSAKNWRDTLKNLKALWNLGYDAINVIVEDMNTDAMVHDAANKLQFPDRYECDLRMSDF
jgi:hypothetical protein